MQTNVDLYHWQSALGLDTSFTPHCIRVLGYNLSKNGNGVDLTVAHGGWMSAAHDRYERFSQSQQLSIPANMLQVDLAAGWRSRQSLTWVIWVV